MIKRIELGHELAGVQLVDVPNDGREEEQNLYDVRSNHRNIAKSSAQETDEEAGPNSVEAQDQHARDREECSRPGPDAEDQHDDQVDHHVVCEDDEVAPQHSEHMYAQGCTQLPDYGFGRDKNDAAFEDQRRDEAPDDDAEGEEWQIIADGVAEKLSVQEAQRADHDPHTERYPEWTDDRAPITVADVVPTQGSPKLPAIEAFVDICQRLCELRVFRRNQSSTAPQTCMIHVHCLRGPPGSSPGKSRSLLKRAKRSIPWGVAAQSCLVGQVSCPGSSCRIVPHRSRQRRRLGTQCSEFA